MFKFSLNFLNKNKAASRKPPVGNQPASAESVASQYVQSQASGQQPVNQYHNNQVQSQSLSEYQAVLNHFKLLLQSGHNQEAIQDQWQRYYAQLSEEVKRSIWQNVTANSSQSPIPAAVPQSVSGAAGQNNRNGTITEKPKIRSFSNFLGIPLAIKSYKSWLSPKSSNKNQKAPDQNTSFQPQVTTNAESQDASTLAKPRIAEILPDKSLNYKTRNMFTWNSPTALFDKDESKSIWRQNIKSIVFGLTVGAILLVVWQFSFFNEQYVQPFTQPSSLNTDAQIIITPGQGEISDPAFKIIIPNISLEAPIVSGTAGFKAVDSNELEAEYEERIQKALEKGTVHYPRTQLPGESGRNFNSNFVILGHSASNYWAPGSYKSVFSKLKDLELGELILINHQRQQYIYKIYGIQIIKPDQVEVLQPGEYNNTLTLITCHPPGSSTNRLVITAIQINPNPANNQSVKENAAAGERESILPGKTQTLIDSWRR